LDFCHVCQTCAFYDALQAGKQKEVHHTPHLKSIMKGTHFADVAAIQERVTAALRSIPKEAFADSFRKLYERCRQCVVKDGHYFEGQ
jgi:hypothetical protein